MRKIELKINHSDLLSEVAKWSYTIGENIGDEQAKARHFVQGATDNGHRALLRSSADDAWAELLQVLSAYTVDGQCDCGCDYKCGCGDGTGVDMFNYDQAENGLWLNDYRVRLWFPDNTYPNIEHNIQTLCYRYMIAKMRSEWEYLTHQDRSVSEAEAERAVRRLKVEISTRTTRQRVKGSWRYGY